MTLTDIPHMNAGSEHQGYHWGSRRQYRARCGTVEATATATATMAATVQTGVHDGATMASRSNACVISMPTVMTTVPTVASTSCVRGKPDEVN